MLFSVMIYNLILLILAPFWLPGVIYHNLRRGRPALGGGFTASDRNLVKGRPKLWLHCVSMGESVVGGILYQRLAPKLPAAGWILTTTTPTGRETLHRLLGEAGSIRNFPLDLPWSVSKAVRTIQPDLLILIETELWPNLIWAAGRRGVKIAVTNGRLSDHSWPWFIRLRGLLRPILAGVDLFLMQSAQDAARIVEAGAPAERVVVCGNLKFDLEPKPAAILPSRRELGLPDVPVLVAGSTHQGEEEILLAAFALIKQKMQAAMVIVPRHLERLAEIKVLLDATGLDWGLRSAPAAGERRVLLVDSYGELPAFYDLATVVLIGGSLAPIGGHNPIEAGILGRPVLFGPHMGNFREARDLLLRAGAAQEVRTPAEIAAAFCELAQSPGAAAAMGAKGRAVVMENRGAAEKAAARLASLVAGNNV